MVLRNLATSLKALACLSVLLVPASSAKAIPFSFNIDDTQSFISLNGSQLVTDLGTFNFIGQSNPAAIVNVPPNTALNTIVTPITSDGMTAQIAGTINGNLNAGVDILMANSIGQALDSGLWVPTIDPGNPGSPASRIAPSAASFGAFVNLSSLTTQGALAVRNFAADLNTNGAQLALNDQGGGVYTFDGTALQLAIIGGTGDLSVFGVLAGALTPNPSGLDLVEDPPISEANASPTATLTDLGGGFYELSIPIALNLTIPVTDTPVNIAAVLNVTGLVVATGQAIPEPGAIVLMGAAGGFVGLGLLRKRMRRNKKEENATA